MGELNDRVYSGTGSLQDQTDWMVAYGPYSTELFEYLRRRADGFDFVIFFTYVFPLTVFGVGLVPGKCALVPTAHDEPEIYIPIFRHVFRSVRALLFSSHAEQRFVNSLFGTDGVVQDVVGVGTERPPDISGARFRRSRETQVHDRAILLYAGRIDERKGCRTLVEYFVRFREEHPEYPLELVLIGATSMDVPAHPDILYLGYVSDEVKFDAFDAAAVIVQPSAYESLSMVALEAWALEKPVLVNGQCEVLRDQCVRSNAGLWYNGYEEFRDELALLLEDDGLRRRLGRSGREFVERTYGWDLIESKYMEVVARVMETEARIACRESATMDIRRRWIGRDLLARMDVIRGTTMAADGMRNTEGAPLGPHEPTASFTPVADTAELSRASSARSPTD
jgi:glycosyltransferase involved in cell wall biosynthesis